MTSPSLEEIYNQYKNRVYNLALHYVGRTEDAEEITQDVFVAVYQSMDAFKNESSIYTWIHKITINKSLDFIKSRKRKKRWGAMTSIFQYDAESAQKDFIELQHPGIEMEQKETMNAIYRGIQTLPDQQKTALLLNKIDGQSHSEIAEIMETSPKAVESLIQRAKKNLTDWLKKNEG